MMLDEASELQLLGDELRLPMGRWAVGVCTLLVRKIMVLKSGGNVSQAEFCPLAVIH